MRSLRTGCGPKRELPSVLHQLHRGGGAAFSFRGAPERDWRERPWPGRPARHPAHASGSTASGARNASGTRAQRDLVALQSGTLRRDRGSRGCSGEWPADRALHELVAERIVQHARGGEMRGAGDEERRGLAVERSAVARGDGQRSLRVRFEGPVRRDPASGRGRTWSSSCTPKGTPRPIAPGWRERSPSTASQTTASAGFRIRRMWASSSEKARRTAPYARSGGAAAD